MTYNFYIGSDNDTHGRPAQLRPVLDQEFQNGYTLVESVGRWSGYQEDSVIVTVTGIRGSFEAEDHAARIARELKQQSVGVLRLSKRDMTFVDPIEHEAEYGK